jgi:hypothetical protein
MRAREAQMVQLKLPFRSAGAGTMSWFVLKVSTSDENDATRGDCASPLLPVSHSLALSSSPPQTESSIARCLTKGLNLLNPPRNEALPGD